MEGVDVCSPEVKISYSRALFGPLLPFSSTVLISDCPTVYRILLTGEWNIQRKYVEFKFKVRRRMSTHVKCKITHDILKTEAMVLLAV